MSKIFNKHDKLMFENDNLTTRKLAEENKASLYEANFIKVNLIGADLRGADLRGADLRGADLRGTDLRGANLRGAHLRGAELYGTDLYGADLHGANFRETDIYRTKGIRIFTAGEFNRLCFTYMHNDEQRYQAGCFNGNYEETVEAIREKYGQDSLYESVVSTYKGGI